MNLALRWTAIFIVSEVVCFLEAVMMENSPYEILRKKIEEVKAKLEEAEELTKSMDSCYKNIEKILRKCLQEDREFSASEKIEFLRNLERYAELDHRAHELFWESIKIIMEDLIPLYSSFKR